jgi:hypothetical protein
MNGSGMISLRDETIGVARIGVNPRIYCGFVICIRVVVGTNVNYIERQHRIREPRSEFKYCSE